MDDCLLTIQGSIAKSDQKAFAQLHTRFYRKLCQFAYSLVRSKETAEEIVEDVFIRIWSNRHSITAIDNLTVYLYVAVKNKALNILSKKAHELVTAPFDFLEIDIPSQNSDPQDLLINNEIMHRMHKAVNDLPPRCKMIFKLVREDGLKYKEVAQILNISVNTIDAQMAIAVKRICKSLQLQKNRVGSLKILLQKKS
jgi:RNA polymerase sigma-70 factor (family 1)